MVTTSSATGYRFNITNLYNTIYVKVRSGQVDGLHAMVGFGFLYEYHLDNVLSSTTLNVTTSAIANYSYTCSRLYLVGSITPEIYRPYRSSSVASVSQ